MSGPETAGLVVLDKPAGLTSHDVVARVRRLAGTKKVGHAGTLDPMATGVLLVGIGRATRLLGHLMLTEKAYDAVVRLGETTTTDDAEGEPVERRSAAELTDEQIREALGAFRGRIEQVPSSVSAVKIGGQRAYKRVRAGEDVVLPPRPVTVHELDAGPCTHAGDVVDVPISVRCSSGTYIRALARDLGAALGVGGHLTVLRRTAVGPFGVDEAVTLDELAGSFRVTPIAAVARRCFPAVDLDDEQAAAVAHGRAVPVATGTTEPVAMFAPDGSFLALYQQQDPDAAARAVAVFV